ncbi:MAG TPA: signal recognition particle-docking protein FtsY [Acidimicrobiia bacterium]
MTVVVVIAVVAVAFGAVTVLRLRSRRVAPAPQAGAGPSTRPTLTSRIALVMRRSIDETFWSDLEDALVSVDMGVATTTKVVDRVRASWPADPAAAKAILRRELVAVFGDRDRSLQLGDSPAVLVVVGVNGSGKTTSIAKIAAMLGREGHRVLIGAADTFRAAAAEQIQEWGARLGVDVIAGQEGADPASVAFDAVAAARARGKDVVVIDTAGRLHSRQNLMDELGKVVRVLSRPPGRVAEVLLVLDGTAGQNGIAQARAFTAAVGVTGVVLSKLDGTARGGMAVVVEEELGIPVKLIGVGESADDLLHFSPEAFVDSLLEGS